MRGTGWGAERPKGPRRGRWSQVEVARLRELYGLRDDKAIARELDRPVASVRRMAEQLYPLGRVEGPWTSEELERLRRYLGAASHESLARILGRTVEEVQQQVRELRRTQRNEPWNQEEISEFKKLYGTRSDEDLAVVFGRSLQGIQAQAEELRLAKDKAFLRKLRGAASATRMPRWSAEEIRILRTMYTTESNLDIAQRLERSVKSVVSKAHNLGLKKSPERLQEMGRENVSLRYKVRRRRSGAEREDLNGNGNGNGNGSQGAGSD